MCLQACSSYVFPRLFGAAKANDVLIGGRKITATEARDWGLVPAPGMPEAGLLGTPALLTAGVCAGGVRAHM